MEANAEIFFEHERWGRALGWSAAFHVAVAAVILVYTMVATGNRGEGWGAGGGGEAIGATLVSTVPLPANPAATQNVVANESKGVTQSQPKPVEKEPDAVEIQGKNTKIKPTKTPTVTKEKPQTRRRKRTTRLLSEKAGRSAGLTAASALERRKVDSASPAAGGILARSMRGTYT